MVRVERREPRGAPCHSVPRDAAVVIAVEIRKSVVAVVVLGVLIEELRTGDDAVVVVVGVPELFAAEMPLVAVRRPSRCDRAREIRGPSSRQYIFASDGRSSDPHSDRSDAPTRTSSPDSFPSPFQSCTWNDFALPRHSARVIVPSASDPLPGNECWRAPGRGRARSGEPAPVTSSATVKHFGTSRPPVGWMRASCPPQLSKRRSTFGHPAIGIWSVWAVAQSMTGSHNQ